MISRDPHLYKLQSMELRDFKSIADTRINFHPLTVIVGANSSGKSSLLQAILALAQTVRSGNRTGRFALNQELVSLGTFEKTKNFKSENPDSPIQITTVIRTEHEVYEEIYDRGFPTPRPCSQISKKIDSLFVESTYALWSLSLTSDRNFKGGYAEIESLQFEVSKFKKSPDETPMKFPSENEHYPLVTCHLHEIGPVLSESKMLVQVPGKDASLLSISGRYTDWNPWWWQVTDEPFEYGDGVGPFGDAAEAYSCDAAVIIGGIPHVVYTKRSRINSYAYRWWDHAVDFLHGYIGTPGHSWAGHPDPEGTDELPDLVSTAAVDYAEELIRAYESDRSAKKKDNSSKSSSNDLKDLGSFVENGFEILSDEDLDKIADGMGQLGESEFRKLLQERFVKEEWATKEFLDESEQSISGHDKEIEGAREIQDFFDKSIRYLGPLRAAPLPLYSYVHNRFDIGINGEYTAAVLHTAADHEVLLPEVDGSSRRTDLISALDYWLQQFGMSDSTQTEDQGLGIELKVSPLSMDKSVDLTSVGVGVSQVLPVILVCLLAEPGDLVVLEQPELHLHPALQQKLTDFLLECTRSGRQLIVETHSEHLINRLRRSITEDDTDETRLLVGLLFAEQHDGKTSFKDSEINSYGGLSEDWPDGFLDLGAREAQSLVRSSLHKRRRNLDRDDQSTALERSGEP